MSNTNEIEELKTCPICIEEIPVRDVVKFARCQHGLCAQCNQEFLMTSNKCPVCREPIQDPEELFHDCLQKLISSLSKTNAALRRVRTVGQIRIDPMSETSTLLKAVQEKFHQLGGLMTDTGIAHVGRSRTRGPNSQHFQNTVHNHHDHHDHHHDHDHDHNDSNAEIQMDFGMLALALASAGLGGQGSSIVSSLPSNTFGMPGSSTSTFTTEFYLSTDPTSSRPRNGPNGSSGSNGSNGVSIPSSTPTPTSNASSARVNSTAQTTPSGSSSVPVQRRTATRRAPRQSSIPAVVSMTEGSAASSASLPSTTRAPRATKSTRSRRNPPASARDESSG